MKFVFDLDGTICYRGEPLGVNMIACLDRLIEDRHEVVFASARPIRDLLPVLPPHLHGCALIGGNGSFVHTGGRQVFVAFFDADTAQSLLSLVDEHRADYLIDGDWHYSFSGDENHPIRRNLDPHGLAQNLPTASLGKIAKVVILRSQDSERLRASLERLPVVVSEHGTEQILDISPTGIDKWNGLRRAGLRSGEFIAFGNDANDMPMFRRAARSVCVGEHAGLRPLSTDCVLCDEETVIRKIDELRLELQNRLPFPS
ncbi:HAD-IIB family hydrolase [Saccharibacillus sacchari]|uniref:HAD-IIB family hydrolase n=1 Tax=Saccharibacillus sacchari TaxID=456493 RepID=A0ACC6P941_9BACL